MSELLNSKWGTTGTNTNVSLVNNVGYAINQTRTKMGWGNRQCQTRRYGQTGNAVRIKSWGGGKAGTQRPQPAHNQGTWERERGNGVRGNTGRVTIQWPNNQQPNVAGCNVYVASGKCQLQSQLNVKWATTNTTGNNNVQCVGW